jgi:hypothetical protein
MGWYKMKKVFVRDGTYVPPCVIKVTTRVCDKCGIEYSLTDFRRHRGGKCFFSVVCISCIRVRKKSAYLRKTSTLLPKINSTGVIRKPPVPAINGRPESTFGQYKRDYEKRWKESNPTKKIACDLRSRIWSTLKGKKKYSHFRELVGCSDDFLKEYLESLFQEGMTWHNHGQYGWHIDHIIPCSSFDLTDPEEQKKCFHYTNLQPLWWYDNIKKGTKIL